MPCYNRSGNKSIVYKKLHLLKTQVEGTKKYDY